MRRIALWNTAFLGDAVLMLPLVQTLASAFPQASIDVYVRKGLRSLFESNPLCTAVYEYDKKQGSGRPGALWQAGRRLASRRYDLWIGAHPSPRSALLARLSGAPVRIGYKTGPVAALCYTRRVSRQFGAMHEIERLLELARPVLPVGFPLEKPEYHWPELVLPEKALRRAEELCAGSAPRLGLHPGSIWGTKRWLPSGFAEIARRAAEAGAQVFVFAGPGEEAVAHEVIALAGLAGRPELHDLSGALSLPELAACLGRLQCYVTNDSGPMHLAWAQKTPVAALFGPTVRGLGFFPRGEGARVFEANVSCRPCGLHGPQECPLGHHHCMTEIDVDAVWQHVAHHLFHA